MKQNPFEKESKTAGVTLLEVLVVLSIIAMISAVVAPRVLGYLSRAKTETAELQIQAISSALQLFLIDTGRYPSEPEGLAALMDAPVALSDWRGPYLSGAEGLLDPWGREYVYQTQDEGNGFVVSSLGRDGLVGGDGEDADLGLTY